MKNWIQMIQINLRVLRRAWNTAHKNLHIAFVAKQHIISMIYRHAENYQMSIMKHSSPYNDARRNKWHIASRSLQKRRSLMQFSAKCTMCIPLHMTDDMRRIIGDAMRIRNERKIDCAKTPRNTNVHKFKTLSLSWHKYTLCLNYALIVILG